MQKATDGAVNRELAGVSLGDRRLDARAHAIAARLAVAPDESFPEQMADEAGLEALYRFFANPKVTMNRLLAPHIAATHVRMQKQSVVRIVHDTTSLRFDGEREGLGILNGETKGFYAHTSLAISGDEACEPLGVLSLSPYIHANTLIRRALTKEQRVRATQATPRAERESSRWERQAIAIQADLPSSVRAIHLMDQEADDFHVFAALQRAGLSFVIRVSPRRVTSEKLPAREVLARKPSKVFRSVHLAERPKPKKGHSVRAERVAELELRWGTIMIRRPVHDRHQVVETELSFNAVQVFEPNPPAGEEPVEWLLLTTEPVENLEEATAIVDHYRARWIIEEYFKALKTGCAIEKRQLTSFDGLTNALALFVPIAWRLLALRHLSRVESSPPATRLFDAEELLLLRALLEQRRHNLPARPTIKDAMLGLARLGGHIRSNGDPGWLVLGRGYIRFAEASIVWNLARRSDQS
ncbi:MAG TPA: IS4 family transposase [Labilithrix sp.]|jgi:hypothetical protein|nr:IS4 family transposase [Labilithrix sp.]